MDKLFCEAGQLVIEKEKASIAMLQRYLKIGFNQALKIMDELCEAGVVGKEVIEGVTPRRILMSQEEFENLRISGKIKVNAKLKNELDLKESQSYLSERINMYNNKIDYMTGEDFELFIAQLLVKIGFSNIQLTKGSGDQGVDIIAEKDNIKYAFQCKRYDQPVGNKAVQEVFAGKFFYHCHAAIVVTNNYFTKSAKKLAHENGVVLWDKDFLDNIIDKAEVHFNAEKGRKKEISKAELTETLKEIAEKINTVFNSFQVHTLITNIDYRECEVVFWLQPPQGVRVKTILSYKQEIEMELKIPIRMQAVLEEGRIGVFILSKDLSVFMERKNIEENGNWKEFEEYHEQLAKTLFDLGMVYVNLINENLNIKSYLADLKRIDEKRVKVIIRCENVGQVKIIKEMEETVNQCINVAEHKMKLINEKDIELLITFH